jgi:LysR family transcriptional regulator, nitrogen assimilation regulatory protein
MIDLKQLEFLCQVVSWGSFSKASAILNTAQPGLSRKVKALEEELGIELLYRNGRGVALTPSGEQFHAKIVKILADLKEACSEAQAQGTVPKGKVTLGVPTSLSGMIGARVLTTLYDSWPDLKLHVVDGFSGYIHEWLVAGRIDLAVLHEERHASNILSEPLFSEDLYLLGRQAPLGQEVRGGELVIPFAQVAKLPLILSSADHGLRRKLDRIAEERTIKLNPKIEVDALIATQELILSGAGYGVLPRASFARELREGTIMAWRIVEPSVSNTMVLAASLNRPFSRAMQTVRSVLKAELATPRSIETAKPAEAA